MSRRPYPRLLEAIEAFASLSTASDPDLDARIAAIHGRIAGGATLESVQVEWFALVREVAHRLLGERPYDVQLLAGAALFDGKLAEMQTGEGKTLAAVAPVSLRALRGCGVHVLTYNDYLAQRDAAWMAPVYERLGLRVAAVAEGMDTQARRAAYAADITYATVKEAGFDYLRDSLSLDPADQVHRPFDFALIDEADSILIDEARIPLVIAGNAESADLDLPRLAILARACRPERDFETDEYDRNIFLTEAGTRRVEQELGCGDLLVVENLALQADIRNALHAEHLLRRDVDYIIREGRVELVDELTGRVAENRQWPDGLQAALEAKEGLTLQAEGKLLSSIAIQHFLGKYPTLAGMTATATPSAHELRDVYALEIVPVPTHRPSNRDDLADAIFATQDAKRRAVIDAIIQAHAVERPVLVGTVSVEESERLAADLRAEGVPCRVLNAKNDAEEAEIVAEAGALGAVTISTNMAGRGTDIKLGGSTERDRDAVIRLGGLLLIGTNRHESRRVDDQLRGRAGRQGDPGTSRFFVSLEDPLMVRYGIQTLLPKSLLARITSGDAPEPEIRRADGSPREIDHPAVRREVARVQRIVEGQYGDIRKRLLEFSLLIERQREQIQRWRQAVLESTHAPLLAEHTAERWNALSTAYGQPLLASIEQRLTLLLIDRGWSDHLAEMQVVRDQIHLVTLDGRNPLTEFYRTSKAAFATLVQEIEDTVVQTFERIEITADGVDWEGEGLTAPSATWTYLVHDNVFRTNTFMTMANRASFGMWAVLLCWWILIPWATVIRIKRWWRARRAARADNGPSPTGSEPEDFDIVDRS